MRIWSGDDTYAEPISDGTIPVAGDRAAALELWSYPDEDFADVFVIRRSIDPQNWVLRISR